MILISFLVFSIYLGYHLIKYKLTSSISATYYNGPEGKYFSPAIIISLLLLISPLIEISPNAFLKFVIAIGIFSLLVVAFTPNYRNNKIINIIHTSNAIFAFILSQIWIIFIDPVLLLLWLGIGGYVWYFLAYSKYSFKEIFKSTSVKLFSEIIMLLTIYLSLV